MNIKIFINIFSRVGLKILTFCEGRATLKDAKGFSNERDVYLYLIIIKLKEESYQSG